jgi:hypothetical protein
MPPGWGWHHERSQTKSWNRHPLFFGLHYAWNGDMAMASGFYFKLLRCLPELIPSRPVLAASAGTLEQPP